MYYIPCNKSSFLLPQLLLYNCRECQETLWVFRTQSVDVVISRKFRFPYFPGNFAPSELRIMMLLRFVFLQEVLLLWFSGIMPFYRITWCLIIYYVLHCQVTVMVCSLILLLKHVKQCFRLHVMTVRVHWQNCIVGIVRMPKGDKDSICVCHALSWSMLGLRGEGIMCKV